MAPTALPRRATRTHLASCGVLLAATLVMFGDVLFDGRGRILSHPDDDLARIFFPWQQFGFGELRRGHLPLWNPHTYAGAPFLGGFQAALLYPPNWLHLALPQSIAINVGIALLVTDNYSAGWRATPLAGSSAERYAVLPADYTLRAIPLAPGTHHLLLEYRPPAFVVGRWITLLSLAAFVGALGVVGARWWTGP